MSGLDFSHLLLCVFLCLTLVDRISAGDYGESEKTSGNLSTVYTVHNAPAGFLGVSINGVCVHSTNMIAKYAAINTPCICHAIVIGHDVMVEWLDTKTNTTLAIAADVAILRLESKHIGSNIICRGRLKNLIGPAKQLPPIAYGPTKITVETYHRKQEILISKKCPSPFYFSCHVDKTDVFPEVTMQGQVSVRFPRRIVEVDAKQVAFTDLAKTTRIDYQVFFNVSGRAVVRCVGTNSVLGSVEAVDEVTLWVKCPPTRTKRSPHNNTSSYPTTVIDKCVVQVGQEKFVDASKVCICQGPYDSRAEWINSTTEQCLSHGTTKAELSITDDIIRQNANIECRTRTTGDYVERAVRILPRIIYGPSKVTLDMSREKVYFFEMCPQRLAVTCSVPRGSYYPKAKLTLRTGTMRQREERSSLGLPQVVNTVIETEDSAYLDDASTTRAISFTFQVGLKSSGLLTATCITTNDVLGHINATDTKRLEIIDSNMIPAISTTSHMDKVTDQSILVVPRKEVRVKCISPSDTESKLLLTLSCGEFQKSSSGLNRVFLLLYGSSIQNGTLCTCRMEIVGCTRSGMTQKRICIVEGELEETLTTHDVSGHVRWTSTTLNGSAIATSPSPHSGDEIASDPSTLGLFVGLGVGVTLAVVLVAIIFFYVGFKVGKKKATKKLTNQTLLGKISFTPNSSVSHQPSGPCDRQTDRGPFIGPHRGNGSSDRPPFDDSYSHIDFVYKGDVDDQYEQTLVEDNKKNVPLPPRGKKNGAAQKPDENVYDQATEYDIPSGRAAADSVYDGYSRPSS